MAHPAPQPRTVPPETLSDEAIVTRVLAGETALFELLMRRHNRRLFRVCRSVVWGDDEAQDVMQEAYVRAFTNLRQFAGESSWATWLTRIGLHEALARVRRQRRFVAQVDDAAPAPAELRPLSVVPDQLHDQEARVVNRDLIRLLESSVDKLPEAFRTVFILREVEGLSVEDVAASLGIKEATVKTRLFRARERLHQAIFEQVEGGAPEAFSFHLSRCDRVVANVMGRIR